MMRSVIVLAGLLSAFPVMAAGPSENRAGDDSFLFAAPARGKSRAPNYVADSVRGQPLDGNDRRRIERPYLSNEATGLTLPTAR